MKEVFMTKKTGMVALTTLLTIASVSCGKPKIDLGATTATPMDTQIVEIPKQCEYLYDTKTWEVAVLEFKNNTGYGQALVGGSSTQGSGVSRTNTVGAGVVVGGPHAAVGVGSSTSRTTSLYSEDSTSFIAEFAPSLSTFAQSVTEEALVSMGGVTVVNRSQLDNILNEQKFQMTVADPAKIMEFGKLAGVKLVFTGSVDNIETKYVAPSNMGGDGSTLGMLVNIVSASVDMAQQGWYVGVTFTLNLIDAETGKVIYSKKFKDSGRATQSGSFQADLIINAAKGLFSNAVTNAKNDLTSIFEVKGYINEMRGGKAIGKINLGSAKGVKEGDTFDLYSVYESTDFMTKEVKCSMGKTGATLLIADHVTQGESWGVISGKSKAIEGVKIGTLAIRSGVAKSK